MNNLPRGHGNTSACYFARGVTRVESSPSPPQTESQSVGKKILDLVNHSYSLTDISIDNLK